MGVNILLFLVFQIGVEPWRRKRLVKGFEDKVMEALEREGSAGATLAEMQVAQNTSIPGADAIEDAQVAAVEEVLSEPQVSIQEDLLPDVIVEISDKDIEAALEPPKSTSTLQSVRGKLQDLFSERQITVRRVDLTTAMLEGAAAGVTVVGALVLLLRPR